MTIRDCMAVAMLFAGSWIGDTKPLPAPEDRAELVGTLAKPVHDGDGLWLNHGDAASKIRLRFVDAPEIGQPFGDVAQKFSQKFLAGKEITCYPHGKSFDRIVADVYVDRQSLAEALIGAGLGWVDERYTKNPKLLKLQADAKAGGKGLWGAKETPIPPWSWRKGER